VSMTLSSRDMFKIELEDSGKASKTSSISHEGLNDEFLHLMASKKLCKYHRENARYNFYTDYTCRSSDATPLQPKILSSLIQATRRYAQLELVYNEILDIVALLGGQCVLTGQWRIYKAGVCDVGIEMDEKTGDLICIDGEGRRIRLFDLGELKEFVCNGA
jgi:hypothetical protein